MGNEAVVMVAPTSDNLLLAMPFMNALTICVNLTKTDSSAESPI
jgi:hypothetical protein